MRHVRFAVLIGAIACAAFVLVPRPVIGQSEGAVASAEGWPDADPEDVASMDAIIAALYDVISGPAGEARDWDRFRSLFIPQARLIPTGRPPGGDVGHQVISPGDYADRAAPILEQRGFFEREISRSTEEFGQIAHAFSTYESRVAPDADPFDRGINSIQLLHDDDRWWIVNVLWAAESSGLTLPDRYTNGGR